MTEAELSAAATALVGEFRTSNDCVAGSPCGRCREFMWQIDPGYRDARAVVGLGYTVTLAGLLPQFRPA